jgi:hypothetical protein
MTYQSPREAAQDMWALWGVEAECMCVENAIRADDCADLEAAKRWREIADALRVYISQRP